MSSRRNQGLFGRNRRDSALDELEGNIGRLSVSDASSDSLANPRRDTTSSRAQAFRGYRGSDNRSNDSPSDDSDDSPSFASSSRFPSSRQTTTYSTSSRRRRLDDSDDDNISSTPRANRPSARTGYSSRYGSSSRFGGNNRYDDSGSEGRDEHSTSSSRYGSSRRRPTETSGSSGRLGSPFRGGRRTSSRLSDDEEEDRRYSRTSTDPLRRSASPARGQSSRPTRPGLSARALTYGDDSDDDF